MLESFFLVLYAAVSVVAAVWIRRVCKLRLDWAHPDMLRPVFIGRARSIGGEGAFGAADAVSTAALASAPPSIVMMFIIAVAGLIGGVIGAGVMPALVGGIGQPTGIGMVALLVAMLAWVWIGGCVALPLLALTFSLAPILIGLGLAAFLTMAIWQTFSSGPSPFDGSATWLAAFGARVDHNLCAAGTSLITVGNPAEVDRKCKHNIVGPHPIEGKYAGVYSCRSGERIAAIVEVRHFGPRRGGVKDAEFLFSDRPEVAFPIGVFAGFVRPSGAKDEFSSDALKWTQKPSGNWGKPDQLSLTAQPDGSIRVKLMNTPCSTLQARRCGPAEAGRVPTCQKEFAQQGVNLFAPKTLSDLGKMLTEQGAQRARAR